MTTPNPRFPPMDLGSKQPLPSAPFLCKIRFLPLLCPQTHLCFHQFACPEPQFLCHSGISSFCWQKQLAILFLRLTSHGVQKWVLEETEPGPTCDSRPCPVPCSPPLPSGQREPSSFRARKPPLSGSAPSFRLSALTLLGSACFLFGKALSLR